MGKNCPLCKKVNADTLHHEKVVNVIQFLIDIIQRLILNTKTSMQMKIIKKLVFSHF